MCAISTGTGIAGLAMIPYIRAFETITKGESIDIFTREACRSITS